MNEIIPLINHYTGRVVKRIFTILYNIKKLPSRKKKIIIFLIKVYNISEMVFKLYLYTLYFI